VSVKANWKPKSENIFEIIKTCNILPQHTLFIDDNPIEISEVSSNIPGILTLTGNQAFWKMNLLYNSSTQAVTISEEAKNKTELVRAIEKRQTDESSMSRDEFLISLNLRVGLEKLGYNDSAQRSRCLELINKTNQFNTTGKKLTEAEFESLLSSANDIYYATASDKFGNHGIISVAIFQNGTITQMVLSCRVFGLGIEDFMIASIMSMHELNDLSFDFIKTTKNSSAKSFLDRFTELNDYTTIRIKKDMIKSPAWISKPH
jgi:FkbH-like protein